MTGDAESICTESALWVSGNDQPEFDLEDHTVLLENEKKENLSHAYVHAIASKAGFSCQHHFHPDNESVDAQIRANSHPGVDSIYNPILEVQLKATSTHKFNGETLSFELSKKNYDDLRGVAIVPRLLVVLVLPEDESHWLIHSEEQLVAKRCAYWYSLLGMPDKKDQRSVTVRIPKKNVLSPSVLQTMMLAISKGEEVVNAS